jgi:hypothetical protein
MGRDLHVLYPMLAKAIGVIITTRKLNIQFALFDTSQHIAHPQLTPLINTYLVDKAADGARILSGTISDGYSHVIPNHPMAKKVLKTNRKTAAAIPLPVLLTEVVPASTAIEIDCPTAPKSIN